MKRRTFLQCGLVTGIVTPLWAALKPERLNEAEAILTKATDSGQMTSAVLHVIQRSQTVTRRFGAATSDDSMFLLGSISKPICVTALMTLFDQGKFELDDPLKKYLPQFTGDGRDNVTIRHLLTHVSGLPDQLPDNNTLRKKHAGLAEFVEYTLKTPLQFAPGSRYQYSSMGILLATYVAQRISGQEIVPFANRVFRLLQMKHSSLGPPQLATNETIPVQTEHAAPESGGGDPGAKDWDWNSPYWRGLGAPWGGVQASAPDLGRFLAEFLHARGVIVKPETAKLMISNHNARGLTRRGLGFDLGLSSSADRANQSFGHSGSTGTIAWADPSNETICVILTSLPGRAVNPHPRDQASKAVAAAAHG